jgi:hypothetical protein
MRTDRTRRFDAINAGVSLWTRKLISVRLGRQPTCEVRKGSEIMSTGTQRICVVDENGFRVPHTSTVVAFAHWQRSL